MDEHIHILDPFLIESTIEYARGFSAKIVPVEIVADVEIIEEEEVNNGQDNESI